MGGASRPIPVPDERSVGYWEAAARHELAIARCASCRSYSHPPEPICTSCGHVADPLIFERVSGQGVIRSWAMVRQALLPGFEGVIPYLIVDVELPEQPELRLTGRLLDGPDAPVRIGMPAMVAFEDIAPGVAVPAFTIRGQA